MLINQTEIKSYAIKVIKKYNLSYPLDIHGFVSTLGFEVRFVDTGKCDAYTIIVNGQKLMLLNQQIESQSRINFTLAHELGHYFIPEHMEPIYACNIDELEPGNRTVNKKEEKEADLFASDLLLPSRFIEKKSNRRLQDIISVAQTYNISIPAVAIRMMEYSYDNVAFVCCKNNKIEWYATSLGFKEHLILKDLNRLSIPELSLMNKCIENNSTISKGKIPAYVWLENMDSSSYIEEEALYYSKYKTGYILISADDLGSIQYLV